MDKVQSFLNKSTAIILVGGKSSRMNYEDKYELKIENRRFIDCILNELRCFDKKVISCNKKQKVKDVECNYIIDDIDGIGPLGGIYTAVNRIDSELIFIASCDMPYISKEVIYKLYSHYDESYDCVIPCIGNDTHNLFGIYNSRIKHIVEENIKKSDYKIQNLLKKINAKYIKFDEDDLKYFININTREEYNRYCEF